ncbi:hypothetical protein ACFW32_01265 [Streptomyces mutabilis]|uniref:hypothetical protein n=1 Tax=Streptomyces mutabilis TaxID=67332 RepID=UPI0036BE2B4B
MKALSEASEAGVDLLAAAAARSLSISAQAVRMSSLKSSTMRMAQISMGPMVCSAIASVVFSPSAVAAGR